MKAESSDTPATVTTPAQPAAPASTAATTSVGGASTTPSSTASATGTGTGTPTPTYVTTQWANSQIPIDPALQQQSAASPYQHYQTYAGHYPTAAYPSHYQAYATPQRPAASTATTTGTTAGNTAGSTGAGNTNVDATDIATLNDALGSAGVDLRAEEESLQRTHGDTQHQHQPFRLYDDRSKKQPPTPNFDTRFLSQTIRTLSTPHKITRIPDDSVNYLALALRARLQDLITSMITAAKHRTSTQFDRPASQYSDEKPMWSIVVRSDVAKQLAAIERAEREEETRIRRERKERADLAAAHAAALAAQANAASVSGFTGIGPGGGAVSAATGIGEDDYEGGTKKKRKKDGPGVTARNMSEDVRKKMSNAVATQAAGLGGRYAWMNATNLNSPIPPKPKPVATATSTTTTTIASTTTATTVGASGTTTTTTTTAGTTTASPPSTLTSSWATPYISTKPKQSQPSQEEADARLAITMRDAMFVIEKERGHGAGRGSARGWV